KDNYGNHKVAHVTKTAVSSKEYRQNYGWILENCQHFVNKCVLGVDFSQETTLIKINENLKKEIENVDRHFNSLTIRSSSELE
ncbi:4456_t:CDS:2, partial [Racocetra persica]